MVSLSGSVGVDGVEDPEFVLCAVLRRDYGIRSARAMGEEGCLNLKREHILLQEQIRPCEDRRLDAILRTAPCTRQLYVHFAAAS